MAPTKKAGFTAQGVRIAEFGKALSHPARVAIIELLTKRQAICGHIVDELPLSQSTVSQHLKVLNNAGLITGEGDGPRVCYWIDPKVWIEARKLFGTFFGEEILPRPRTLKRFPRNAEALVVKRK